MVGTVAVFGRQRGHLVLSCIASIGKGLRSEGEVIDIELTKEGDPALCWLPEQRSREFFLAFVPFPGHYASTG
jgi:hypothetical protein